MDWRDNLSELQRIIISVIDTGNNRDDIISQVVSDHPEFSKKDIHRELSEMRRLWLVIHRGGGYYTVTAWSRDGILELTGASTFDKALRILESKGIYHCDIRR